MTNIVIFGTRSKRLRATIRRSNYPEVEVTIGSPAYMALPQAIRDEARRKCLEYITELQDHLSTVILPPVQTGSQRESGGLDVRDPSQLS